MSAVMYSPSIRSISCGTDFAIWETKTSINQVVTAVPATSRCQASPRIRITARYALRNRNNTRNSFIHASSRRTQVADPSDKYFEGDERPIILFDGVCNLCNGGVNFMLDHDTFGKVRFAALQSSAGRSLLERAGRLPDDITSIVLVDNKSSYTKSDAILKIAQQLGLPFLFLGSLGLITPLFFRDFIYDTIANNRYNILGKQATCRLYDERCRDRFVVD